MVALCTRRASHAYVAQHQAAFREVRSHCCHNLQYSALVTLYTHYLVSAQTSDMLRLTFEQALLDHLLLDGFQIVQLLQ